MYHAASAAPGPSHGWTTLSILMADHSPDPSLFWSYVNGYQRSAAIRAAVDHDLFTAVAEGAVTAPAVAERRGIPERGVRILLDYLAAGGFFTKSAGRYELTPDSAVFLDKRSPAYLGGMIGFLQHPLERRHFWEASECVMNGTIPAGREEMLTAEHEVWGEFARAMKALMAPMADFMAGVVADGAGETLKTLDIAAGHGLFGIAVAKTIPQAQVVAQDWAGVLQEAEANAAKAGVADRHQLLPGDAFEVDFGTGYDLVLVTNFFHHFSRADCVRLMKRIHSATKPGSRVVTLEFIPDDDRTGPAEAVQFGLTMLVNTPAGDAYTFSEYAAMFEQAEFGPSRLVQPPFGPQQIVVTQR